ncbi:hypothetical protein CMV_007391 [Castanea mollissima]|uniref:Uncharacterized protein n=1 Tax=Castanea mollissima TaxID=60419 RepID=A0A8J4W0B9_9ROSI|nr:hypothetical protein CMV_007391 [Castanea mollissima]
MSEKLGRSPIPREMITRSKLVEQLRDYQIRSQNKCPALSVFSPKPHIASWADVAVAIFWALVFSMLVISSYVSLYFRHFWLCLIFICLVKSCLCTLAENGSSLTFDSFGFHFIRCLSTDIVDKDSCLPLSQDDL